MKGFTLIEVMIVVAIMGILIAIAIPGIQRVQDKQKAEAALKHPGWDVKQEGKSEIWTKLPVPSNTILSGAE